MLDVQKQRPKNERPINKVGVKGVTYPIMVKEKHHGLQATVAEINMYVSLPREYRGTHMSRFLEILNHYRGCMSRTMVHEILHQMKVILDADASHIEISFPYFIEKAAPVSGEKSLMGYQCRWLASEDDANYFSQTIEVAVPVMNLCPCSKEMSQTAAHNQRGKVVVQIESNRLYWIEDIVAVVESSASSPVYALLKREDEKYVSEHAYENPRFVEDIVREVAETLATWTPIKSFTVEAENFESIHNHNAYAVIYGAPVVG